MANFVSSSNSKIVTYLRILYPVWMIVGMFSLLFVTSKIVVADNSAETAKNIVNYEMLFKVGIAAGLLTQLIHIIAVVLLSKLFYSVDRKQTILLMIFGLIGVPIAMVSYAPQLGALLLANRPDYLMIFEPNQLDALVYLFLKLSDWGIVIASIFWGLWLLPLGYLSIESKYFPKYIGYFLYIGGVGYAFSSFTKIIFPNSVSLLAVFDIMTFGEIVFVLWLVILGAKLPKEK